MASGCRTTTWRLHEFYVISAFGLIAKFDTEMHSDQIYNIRNTVYNSTITSISTIRNCGVISKNFNLDIIRIKLYVK